MSWAGRLAGRELIVVTGKGGVGKTAFSAMLGRALAELGRRVLVAEVDPRENLHQMLGVPPSGGDILSAGHRLWVQNLSPQRVIDEVVREQIPMDFLANRVLDSTIYHHFTAGAPGLKEMAVLGQALRLLRGAAGPGAPRLDTVVLDAPATGHGVSLLAAPLLVSDVIRKGPFGRMSAEVATLVGDSERCGVVAVTLAEEMPVAEVLELAGTLAERVGRGPELLVVNGLYPPVPPLPEAAPGGSTEEDPGLELLWRRRRALHERELARLGAEWRGPRIELPKLPIDRGPALVAALGRCAAEQREMQRPWS